MPIPYAPASGTLGYSAVMAASAAIEARTAQHAPLLSIQTTYRTVVKPGGFIALPRPMTPSAVAVIEERVNIAAQTAAAALSIDGVHLAVDARTLAVGGQDRRVTNDIAYRWYSDRIWQFTDYYGDGGYGYGYESDAVWIDGTMGWGRRVPVHGTGFPENITVDSTTLTYMPNLPASPLTQPADPTVGTVLQWDDEIMAVSAIDDSNEPWTLELDRGLAGTEIVGHRASTTLFRLDVPPNLREAATIVAKRLGHIDDQPGAGPEWSTEGDTTVNLFRNVDPLIVEFWRPHEA